MNDDKIFLIIFLIGLIYIILYSLNIEMGIFILIGMPCSIFLIGVILTFICNYLINLIF